MDANMTKYLIPNWKQAWRYVSVQLALLMTVLLGLEQLMPQIVTYLPPEWQLILSGAILVARIVQQTKVSVKEAKDVQQTP